MTLPNRVYQDPGQAPGPDGSALMPPPPTSPESAFSRYQTNMASPSSKSIKQTYASGNSHETYGSASDESYLTRLDSSDNSYLDGRYSDNSFQTYADSSHNSYRLYNSVSGNIQTSPVRNRLNEAITNQKYTNGNFQQTPSGSYGDSSDNYHQVQGDSSRNRYAAYSDYSDNYHQVHGDSSRNRYATYGDSSANPYGTYRDYNDNSHPVHRSFIGNSYGTHEDFSDNSDQIRTSSGDNSDGTHGDFSDNSARIYNNISDNSNTGHLAAVTSHQNHLTLANNNKRFPASPNQIHSAYANTRLPATSHDQIAYPDNNTRQFVPAGAHHYQVTRVNFPIETDSNYLPMGASMPGKISQPSGSFDHASQSNMSRTSSDNAESHYPSFPASDASNLKPMYISMGGEYEFSAGQILVALNEFHDQLTEAQEKVVNRELKKKKGLEHLKSLLPTEPKSAKCLAKLGEEMRWLMARQATSELSEGITSEDILHAFAPITKKLLEVALTLRNAGDPEYPDGYVKFPKNVRQEVADEISRLCISIGGLVNLLIGNPLKKKRMSNPAMAEQLYQRAQHAISMLEKSEKAWKKDI